MAKSAKQRLAEKELADFLKRVVEDENAQSLPQIADVCAAVIVRWGGAEGLAGKLIEDYEAAPAGSQQRVRLLELIMNSVRKSDELPDLTKLENCDLERVLESRLNKLHSGPEVAAFNGESVDAQ